MLAPGFTEFGQSGRSWTRAEMMDAIGGFESSSTAVQVEALRGRELAPDIVLVTYESSGARGTVRRSSIWKRNPAGWQVEFHQGTPTA